MVDGEFFETFNAQRSRTTWVLCRLLQGLLFSVNPAIARAMRSKTVLIDAAL